MWHGFRNPCILPVLLIHFNRAQTDSRRPNALMQGSISERFTSFSLGFLRVSLFAHPHGLPAKTHARLVGRPGEQFAWLWQPSYMGYLR